MFRLCSPLLTPLKGRTVRPLTTAIRLRAMATPFANAKNESDLYQTKVQVHTVRGEVAEVNLVYQDTKPGGSDVGTLVAVHGAPGSHKDYKYVTPYLIENGVRVIGVNWPGMGYTSYDERLREENDERVQMVQQLVDGLGLSRVVFMGHSRGTENALKMAANNPDRACGLVLVNPVCLKPHRGVQPYQLVRTLGNLWKSLVWLRFILNPFLHYFYNKVLSLRTNDGQCAGICLHMMNHVNFAEQRDYINKINQHPSVRSVFCFSGKDFLIQPELSQQMAACFDNNVELVTTTKTDDPEVIQQLRTELNKGTLHLSAYFKPDGHFLQKTRAKFLADTVLALLNKK